jgi:hypothetical protein
MKKMLPLMFLLVAPGSLSAFELCFAPSSNPGGLDRNVSVNCDPDPLAFDNDWIGYRTNGPTCGTVSTCTKSLDYLWTLSTSDTDPFVNTGPLPPQGCLYLWFVCTSQGGLAAAAFDLVGDLNILGFIPMNGFLDVFPQPPEQFVLAVPGCPSGPVVAGKVLVTMDPVSVESTSFGKVKSLYR